MYYFDNYQKKEAKEEKAKEVREKDLLKIKRKLPELRRKIETKAPLPTTLPKKVDTNRDEDWEDVLDVINQITNKIHERDPEQKIYVERLAELRGLDPQPLLNHGCFYSISPHYMEQTFQDLNLFRSRYHITTASNTMWKGRFIIPLRDFNGNVYGFVGYDKTSEAKYVEYSSPVYKAIPIKALGLNSVENMIESKYCIITEGSMDYFRGIQNEFSMLANLGVKFNKQLKPILNRMDIVFVSFDNDKAGRGNVETIKRLHPFCYNIRFKTEGMDFDDALKSETNIEKLRKEVQLRLNHLGIRMKDIVL